jgi:hypothetical protein
MPNLVTLAEHFGDGLMDIGKSRDAAKMFQAIPAGKTIVCTIGSWSRRRFAIFTQLVRCRLIAPDQRSWAG